MLVYRMGATHAQDVHRPWSYSIAHNLSRMAPLKTALAHQIFDKEGITYYSKSCKANTHDSPSISTALSKIAMYCFERR